MGVAARGVRGAARLSLLPARIAKWLSIPLQDSFEHNEGSSEVPTLVK